MRVDLALFNGDDLLDRGQILVGASETTDAFKLFRVQHHLAAEAADIVLSDFVAPIDLRRVTLDMPIHESDDWESIELGPYTVAFWCRLEA